MPELKENPPGPALTGLWFELSAYPDDVPVCPLCHLPGTEGEYVDECQCWEDIK